MIDQADRQSAKFPLRLGGAPVRGAHKYQPIRDDDPASEEARRRDVKVPLRMRNVSEDFFHDIWVRINGFSEKRIASAETDDLLIFEAPFSPGTNPEGIGGEPNTFWHTDSTTGTIYELETTTAQNLGNASYDVIRSATTTFPNPFDVGGTKNRIWSIQNSGGTYRLYELSTIDFSPIRFIALDSTYWGCGGDNNVIWTGTRNTPFKIEKRHPSDLSVSQTFNQTYSVKGVGGSNRRLWAWIDPDGGLPLRYTAYELSTSDGSIIVTGNNFLGTRIGGIGGK